jgi:hypothetical protein
VATFSTARRYRAVRSSRPHRGNAVNARWAPARASAVRLAVPGVRLVLALGRGEEMGHAHVDTGHRTGRGQWFGGHLATGEDDVAPPAPALDADRPDPALDGPAPVHPNLPHAMQADAGDAGRVRRKSQRQPSPPPWGTQPVPNQLTPRNRGQPDLSPALDPPEEPGERPCPGAAPWPAGRRTTTGPDVAGRTPGSPEAAPTGPRSGRRFPTHAGSRPGAPATPRYRASSEPPSNSDTARARWHAGRRRNPHPRRSRPPLPPLHPRTFPPGVDATPHRIRTHRAHRCHEQRRRPQRGHPRTQMPQLLPQHPRRVTPEPVRHTRRGRSRLVPDQQPAAAPRAPHHVHPHVAHATGIPANPPRHSHPIITQTVRLKLELDAIPPPAKAGDPLATFH